MPLPSTCPMEFAAMPEHFVEDAMELLIFASRIPRALDGVLLVYTNLLLIPFAYFLMMATKFLSIMDIVFCCGKQIRYILKFKHLNLKFV